MTAPNPTAQHAAAHVALSLGVLSEHGVRARLARINLARVDFNEFCRLVMKDESTGKPVAPAPLHVHWSRLATAHDRLVIWSHIESGKSNQLTIARTLWELGRDPTLRFAIVSNTWGQAEKLMQPIKKYLETSVPLRQVFPALAPSQPWSSSRLTVRRPTFSKDPSIQGIGIHGNILGARIDRLILDDVLDYENVRTKEQRDQLYAWYRSTLAGRLTERAKVLAVGTAWHPDDVMHRLVKESHFQGASFPVINPDTGASRWPERWSLPRIAQKREELGPLEFARQMLCQARDDSTARFQRAWIERCLARGNGKRPTYGLQQVPPGFKTVTGVDLAVQQKDSADLTAMMTLGIHPDGTREVLNLESGRWSGPEIVARIINIQHRFQSLVIIENNAAQDFILQFVRNRAALPLRAFTTGRNKAHPEFGVESIAAEMAAGKWIIPNINGQLHPELQAWVDEMLYYDAKAHTGDRLMAAWFCREGVRLGQLKSETGYIATSSR